MNETRLAGAGNAGVLKRSSTTYVVTTGSASSSWFTYPGSVIEESWDHNGVALPSTSTYYEYDPAAYTGGNTIQWGDPSRIAMYTRYAGQDVARKLTINQYRAAQTGSGQWILGRLTRASVTSTDKPAPFAGFNSPPPPPSLPTIVVPPPLVVLPSSATVSGPPAGCSAGMVMFKNFTAYASVNGGKAPYQYSWSNSNPVAVVMAASAGSAVLSANPNGAVAGSSVIRVTVTDALGRSATSNALNVISLMTSCRVSIDAGGA